MVGTPTADQLNNVKQATVQWSASAHRVFLVDSAGSAIKIKQSEENRLGSECSGADGATERVLTLVNTVETAGPVSVWVENQLIAQSDLTVTHKTASSTIKFAIAVNNTDTIKVLYYE